MKKIFNRILKGDSGGKAIIWEAGLVLIAVLVLFWSRDAIDQLKIDTVNQGNKKADWIFEGGKPSNGDDVEIEHTHWYSNYTIIEHPFCLDEGKATVKCTCGEEREVILPALGHNFVDGVCTRCGLRDPILDRSTVLLSGPEFNATIPAEAKSIVFVSERLEDEDFAIDVSAAGDKGVVAWLDGDVYKVSTQRASAPAQANENSSEMFSGKTELTYINFGHLRTDEVKDMSRMFYESTNIVELDLTGFNTENVTNMNGMFAGSDSSGDMLLNKIEFGTWNTSNVENMGSMFQKCASLQNIDVKSWNVSNVKYFNSMFTQCKSLSSLDVTNWDTSNAENMYAMFNQCESLSVLNVSNWKTGKVTNMGWLFYGCSKLSEINVSRWNVSSVESTHAMFYNCKKISTLDVSGWNVSNVKDMAFMFNRCENITMLDVSKWVTSNAETMEGMFYGCEQIEELNLYGFDTTKVSVTSNMFDDCIRLRRVTIGEKYAFVSADGYLPTPNSTYIDDADGRWYNILGTVDAKGTAYIPKNVKSNVYETYIAVNPVRSYVVKHWIQKIGSNAIILNEENYTVKEIENKKGITGESVTPGVKAYEGFTSPTVQTEIIADDDSTVINYYYTRNKYTVSLVLGNGIKSVSGDGLYEYDQDVTINAVVSDGYTWSKWTGTLETTDQEYKFKMPANNVENKATTTTNVYSITYNTNDGILPDDTVYEFTVEDTIELPTPTKTGYTFDGWYSDRNFNSERVDYINKEFGDKVFYAKWILNEYKITYETNNGELPNNAVRFYSVENHVNLPEPTREGAIFAGWYKDEGFIDGPKTSTHGESSDITYYAKWDLIDYAILYEPYGGTMPETYRTTYNIENHATLPIPTKQYYVFAGWCKVIDCSDTPVTSTVGELGDLKYYAKWVAEDYDIVYETNGGTMPSDAVTSYNIETEVTLSVPTREGYEFGGWYNNASLTGNPVEKIPVGSNGTKTFYAKWYEIIPFAIYSETDNSLTFYYRGDEAVIGEEYNGKVVTNKYVGFENGAYTASSLPEWNEVSSVVEEVIFYDEIIPENTATWFYGFVNCESFDLEKLNTSEVKDMSYMFYSAGYNVTELEMTGMDGWNTSNVENMYGMFYMLGHESIRITVDNLTEWNVSKVKDMSFMFTEMAYNANIWSIGSISNWNTISVEKMYGMFDSMAFNANSFDLGNIGSWNVSNVTDMAFMFSQSGKNAGVWNIGNVIDWNVEKVTNMNHMFHDIGHGTTKIKLDLSNWVTTDLVNTSNMFSYSNIKELYLDNFDMSNVTSVEQMFIGCRVLDKISIGENFEFKNASGYLPEPSNKYIEDADGYWYNILGTKDEIGTSYMPSEIPNNIKEIYTAENPSAEYTVNHYLETLNGGYELEEAEKLKGVKNTEMTAATKEYEGFSAPELQTKVLKEDGSVVFDYYYTRNEYTYNVVYKSVNDVEIERATVTYLFGTTNVIDPKDFNGYTKPESQTITWDSVDAKEIVFVYDLITYNVTIDCAGGSGVTGTTYTIETETFTLDQPEKEGYAFAGWTGSNGSTPQTNVSIVKGSFGDKAFSAKWTANKYTYHIIGKSINSVELYRKDVTYDFDTTNVIVPDECNGYTSPSSQTIVWDSVNAKDIVFEYTPIEYTISIDCNGGYGVDDITYDIETETFTIDKPNKNGYAFIGWTGSNGEIAQEDVTIPKGSFGNKEYVANWSVVEYTITYELNGGTNPDNVVSTYTIESGAELPVPTKDGYVFGGWYEESDFSDDAITNIEIGAYGNKTFYAKWCEIIPFAIYSETDNSLTFYYRGDVSVVGEEFNGKIVTNKYIDFNDKTYTANSLPKWSDVSSNVEKVIFYDEIIPENTATWFYGFVNCESFDLEKLDTSNVKDMSYMFYRAGYNVSELEMTGMDGWNTSNVEDMYAMFYMLGHESRKITIDNLTEWDVSKVKDMSFMFTEMAYNANVWSIGSIANWDTMSVEKMYGMFDSMAFNADSFDLGNIGSWNVSNVIDMAFMFSQAGKNAGVWNIGDVSGWNVEKVTNMNHMFHSIAHGTTKIELNLSGWVTSSVINTSNMFSYSNIKELYLDNFDMTKVTSVEQMFIECSVLDKISIGENFEFKNASGYLPRPSDEYIEDADGYWYNIIGTEAAPGTAYEPSEIPNNVKEIYIAKNPSAKYIVNHYLETLNGEYELEEAEELMGVEKTEVTPITKEYEGFSAPESQTKVLKKDETVVFNYYYTRNEYAYNIVYKSVNNIELENTTISYLYGSTNVINPKDFNGYTSPESQTITWDDVNAKTITFVYTPITYNVTIDCAGGSGVTGTTYTIETETFTLSQPEREGYTFAGWTGSNGSTPQTTVSITKGSFGDKTYTANWSAVSYSIEYNLNGGVNPSDAVSSYTIEQNVTLPTPTKTGYTFDGWYTSSDLSGEKVTSIEMGNYGDKVFYAGWKANEYTYNIVYKSVNGAEISTGTVSYLFGTTNVIVPKDFNGYTSPESQTITWDDVNAKTITFVYTPITYNVTIDCAGGSGVSGTTYTIETETFTLGQPEREGYTFAGWTGSNGSTPQTTVSIAKGSFGDKTYTANWSTVSYSIKYNLNGGTNPSDAVSNYTIEDRVVLPTPSKNGYAFEGWFESSNFDGQPITAIETGSIGNKEYYANWSIVEYEIKYNLNGGTNPSDAELVYTIETGATLPVPTRPGYVFDGWYESSDFGGEAVTSIEIGSYGEKEFYAKWAEIEIYAVYSETDNSLMFYENADAPSIGSEYRDKVVTQIYKNFNDVEERNENDLPWNDEYKDDIVKVVVVDEIAPKNTSYWFYDFVNCALFDLANLDVSNVTNMAYMFAKSAYNVSSFEIDGIEEWSVSRVEDMYSMFYQTGYNANKFELDLSSWTTSSVKDMSFMFDQAGYKAAVWTVGSLNNWTVSNVENMNSMFNAAAHNANIFALGDLEEWNVSKVENMSYMFASAGENASSWNVGEISDWDVSSVERMDFLFHSIARGTEGIELDLSGWTTTSLVDANNMFSYAYIKELYLDSFNMSKVIDMERMFGDCRVLEIVSVGNNFKFIGENGYFPVIDEEYVERADGKWYNTLGTIDEIGTAYLPNEVHNNVREIYTSISPIAKYTVLHWGQKVGGNAELKNEGNYDVIETQEFRALIGSEQYPEIKEYEGFTSPTEKESVVILEDNSAVVNYYYTRNTYTVTLNVGEYIDSVIGAGTYQFEQSVTINANVKNGYQWKEWTGEYNTTDQEYTFEMPAKDIELTANGDVIVYSLEFEPNGGTMPSDVPTEYSEKDVKTLPNPTKEGYTFGGWYESSDCTGTTLTTTTGLAGNKVLYAKWNANLYTYNVVYKSTSGVTIETGELSNLYGETIFVPSKPFDGYTSPEGKEVAWDSVTPKEIVFEYEPITYNVTIDCAGGSDVTGTTYTIETETFTLGQPEREGYTFAGWTGSNGSTPQTTVSITKGSFGDKTYAANWSAVSYSIEYNLNGGTNPDDAVLTYTIEDDVTLPTPSKTGYTFNGWYTKSDFSDDVVTTIAKGSTGNKAFYAKWTVNEYVITYNLNGGTNPDDAALTYTVENDVTLPTPSKTGYTFDGWYTKSDFSDNVVTAIAKGTVGDKAFYAKWTVNQYTYNIIGKSINDIEIYRGQVTYNYGTTNVITPEECNGYVTPGSLTIAWDSVDAKDIVFEYTPIEYTISIDCNGGYGVDDITYNIETTTFTIDKPDKNGYDFIGWTGSNGEEPQENVVIQKGSFGNKEYAANWSIVEYTIRYELDGGTNPDDAASTYTIESSVELPIPTKDRYVFSGWYETSDFEGESITNIEVGTYGNKTFYAKWTEITIFAIYSETDHSLMFYEDSNMPNIGDDYNNRIVNELYVGFDNIKEKNINKVPWQNGNVSNIEKVVVVNTIAPTNTAYWFYDFVNCSSFELANLDVSNVTDMTYMFAKSGYNTNTYTVNGIEEWDTSKVESMYAMFHMAGFTTDTFELNLDLLNTESVTDMSFMLDQAGYNAIQWYVGDLSSWKVDNVVSMNSTFNAAGYNANDFDLGDLSEWNVENVNNMDYMFGQAGRNSVYWNLGEISNWNVSNVVSMEHMFQSIANGSTGIVLDLSEWVTTSLTNTNNMFAYANVSELYLNLFDMTNVTDMYRMFSDCVYLEKISIGDKFKFIDLNSYFPAPKPEYIDGANGNWYNTVGTGYAPEDVPEGISDTYIAINPEATYVVKHWVEDIYASGGSPKMKIAAAPEINDEITYSIREIEVKTGVAGSVVSPLMKDYDGFTPESSRKTAKIKGDGSLVIDYYYSRNKYNVKLEAGEGIDSVIGEGTYKYGETVSVLAYIEAGCTFYGWTGDLESEDERYIFEMPAKDILLIAKAEYSASPNSLNLNRETYNNSGVHEHSYEIKNQVESTCIQEGYVEYYCECGDNYIEYSENENTNHGNYETYTMITIDPTCGSDGKMVEICSGCGDIIKESVIPSTENHDMDEWGTCYICGIKVN